LNGSDSPSGAAQVLRRLQAAINKSDIDAFVECFSPSYRSEQPVHPNRAFGGYDQVRKNWSAMFSEIPDLQAEILAESIDGPKVWSEWRWAGTRADGAAFEMRGVTIMGIAAGVIEWARLYMEPVEQQSADIDEAVRSLTKG
jgi:hypothetical protein